jgi:hypothetical protein
MIRRIRKFMEDIGPVGVLMIMGILALIGIAVLNYIFLNIFFNNIP